MKRVCRTCRWFENLPFADEGVCTNEESEYADCSCDDPENDTCDCYEEGDNDEGDMEDS